MAVDNFIYQGINRAVTDYTGAQVCEELINLRPTTGGVVPVKEYNALFGGTVAFDRVYIHHTTSGDNYIAIRKSVATQSQSTHFGKVTALWVNPTNGNTIATICEITATKGTSTEAGAAADRLLEGLHYAAAGNIILFSERDDTDGIYVNQARTFKMVEGQNVYAAEDGTIPIVTLTLSPGDAPVTATEQMASLVESTDDNEVVSTVESALNSMQENNPDLCLGPIIYAIAFKTRDGQTFWTEKWDVYDPVPRIKSLYPTPYCDVVTDLPVGFQGDYTDFFTKYTQGAFNLKGTPDGSQVGSFNKITVYGSKVSVTVKLTSGWNEDTSVIQSVELYCSRPAFYMDTTKAGEGFQGEQNVAAMEYMLLLPLKGYEEMDLGGQLMYLQKSIPLTALQQAGNSGVVVPLTFGGNIQMTEDSLDADAGRVQRFGNVISYNARFHYFDSVARTDVSNSVSFLQDQATGNTATWNVLVSWEDAEHSGLYRVASGVTLRTVDAYLVIASSINVKEVIAYTTSGATRWVKRYKMSPSTSYNYSICTEGAYYNQSSVSSGSTEIQKYEAATSSYAETEEKAAINVSEQYNPFVFRVEHSYLAPGNVLDVQPQMAAVIDQSYGTDPLNVFTTRGVYALTQGSADVLYGAFIPITNIVAVDGGLGTEQGTFFLGAGNLWLIAGRRLTLISDALSRGPHKYIRACTGYKKLSGTDTPYSPDPAPANPVYDISPYLSQVEFETFSNGGQLSYNRFRDEIYVSNPSYGYTYVISLKYRQWFKLSYRIYQDEKGSTIGNIPVTSSTMRVVDFSTENAGHVRVHMQSRPFSMGYQYAHVHRIVAMMRASLSGFGSGTAGAPVPDLAVSALYGSDDLQNWKLLAYAQRKGKITYDGTTYTDVPLQVSQIRTPSAARSWRYYTVCIGGYVPTDSEIGPVLVDYEPVVRRIG